MKNKQHLQIKLNRAVFLFLLTLSGFVMAANAQSDRTFVATTGADSPTCGAQTSPCRSFNVALPKTNAGGEVIALDSGIYDSFNIVISLSVTLTAAPGVHAELSNTHNDTDRVTINAPNDSRVVLRNFYISRQTSFGGGNDGIKVQRVGSLHIENCVIDGFNEGISFDLNNSAEVFIQDTTVRNSLADGISFFTNSGTIKASISRSHFDDNGTSGAYNGVNVSKRSKVTVSDSTANGNGSAGFVVSDGDLNLQNCAASNNRDGVVTMSDSLGSGTATVSGSVVTNNSRNGFYQLGGVFQSLGNNVVRRNGTNMAGTINVISGS